MTPPVRIQRRRTAGFKLQDASLNGLPVVYVGRGTKWGNPFDFRKSDFCWAALSFGCRGDAAGRHEASVRAYRDWIAPPHGRRTLSMTEQPKMVGAKGSVALGPPVKAGEAPSRDEIREALRGKNLACWCKPGQPCHADVLLELANGDPEVLT